MDVDLDVLAREGVKFLPTPAPFASYSAAHMEIPVVERHTWGWPCRKNREVGRHVLAGRHAVRLPAVASFAGEAA
jgi:hypothetical protein